MVAPIATLVNPCIGSVVRGYVFSATLPSLVQVNVRESVLIPTVSEPAIRPWAEAKVNTRLPVDGVYAAFVGVSLVPVQEPLWTASVFSDPATNVWA